MFDPDTILMYHRQRHQDFVAEVTHHKLVQIAYSGRGKQHPRYHETLAALGRQMVNWGERLQARYTPVELVVTCETVR